jgi:uncharacterized membrane protein YbhN (UPF0104 family)
MLQNRKNKSSKWWLIIKLLLASCALWFIYRKVISQQSDGDYLSQIKTALLSEGTLSLFIIVFLMMVINWTIEAVKWKFMIRKIEDISLGRSVEAVFSGITISLFTPNRIGEYAGRVFHLHEGKRMQGTIITVIENFSQLLITFITGSIACIFYMNNYLDLNPFISILWKILQGFFCIISLMFYFNIDFLERVFLRFRLSDYWKQIFHVFSLYTPGELFRVLIYSLFRYIVFSTQFFLLLKIYGSNLEIFPAFLMIAMTFFVMSVVPTFAIAELGIRGAIAAYFFGKITIDVLPVLNATFSLWLINLVIPAFAGAFSIFHFRLEKINK